MLTHASKLSVRLASSEADHVAAMRLRYRVFVEELGGDGPLVDHDARLEQDRFDPFFEHLVLVDATRDASLCDHVVGVYRIMSSAAAERAGQFYSESEYDLSVLRACGRPILELGRSCVDKSYRGGAAVWRLWAGLAAYVEAHDIEVLFGVASFHGTDLQALRPPLSLLHDRHLAPEELRVRSLDQDARALDLLPPDQIDAPSAMKTVPALIKSYLRLGGYVGDGAFVDRDFNTTDVCLILDVAQMSARQRTLLTEGR